MVAGNRIIRITVATLSIGSKGTGTQICQTDKFDIQKKKQKQKKNNALIALIFLAIDSNVIYKGEVMSATRLVD